MYSVKQRGYFVTFCQYSLETLAVVVYTESDFCIFSVYLGQKLFHAQFKRVHPIHDIVKHWNFVGPFFRLAPRALLDYQSQHWPQPVPA